MPPPSLAGVDESGMSDFDNMGSILTDRGLKVDQTASFLEADLPIDGPPDCERSPVEHYLSKYGVGGMENVLSGSEEDIHLQCVNTFFERLRGLTEAEQPIEPSQVKVGKTREAEQGEQMCSDGPQASNTALPENITKLNFLPANNETAAGKETTVTVNAKRKTNTMKKDEPDSRTVPELADSNSDIENNKSSNPETESFIREEDWLVMTANEVRKQSQPHESLDVIVCSVKTPDSDGVLSSEMDVYKHLEVANHRDMLTEQTLTILDKSPNNLEVMAQDELEEDKAFSVPLPEPDSKSTNKRASPLWSPSTLIKKKRRRKKRVSTEPVESCHGYERQFLANQSDSDQETFSQGRGMDPRFSDQTKKIDCSVASVAYSEVLHGIAFSNLPLNSISVENKVNILSPSAPLRDSQCQNLSERFDPTESSVLTNPLVRDGRSRAIDLDRSASLPDSTDYSIISTPNYGDNVATNSQHSTLQVQTSTESPELPVSSITCRTNKSGPVIEVGNSDRKTLSTCQKEVAHTESLHQSDQMNYTLTSCCESEIHLKSCAVEDISITQSNISQSGESNSSALVVSQHGVLTDKVTASKSGLAVEVGNSGRDSLSLCQREAKPPQQLEMDCQDKAQNSSTFEKTNFPMSPIVMIGSDTQEEFKNRSSSTLNDNPTEVASANLTLESSNSLPDKSCRPKVPRYSLGNNRIHHTKHSHEFKTSSKAVPENDTSESPGTVNCTLTYNSTIEVNPKLSISEDLLISQSYITPNGSSSTLEDSRRFDGLSNKELVTALSNTNITNMSSEIPDSSVTQINFSGQTEQIPQIPVTDDGKGDATVPKSLDISGDTSELKYDSESKTEGDVPTSATENGIEKAPDSKHSMYAMSSFWSEMENLTIKDILGLRMVSNAPLPGFLPPMPESEEVDISDAADSGYLTHLDDPHPHHSSADMFSIPDPVVSEDSCNPVDVMWESEPDPVSLGAGIYPENMTLTSVRELPQPLLSSSTGSSSQKYLKKMCKNTSMRNLHALESGPYSETWKAQGLLTVITEEGQIEIDYFTDSHMARRDSGMDSLPPSSFTEDISTQNYGISLTNIFQYLFGGKPSTSSTSDVDNTVTNCVSGNTVPEMYDHFFSDFDAGSLFYPFTGSSGQATDEPEPVLSYSHSTSRNLHFPDAYDHFFSSSSSDDSSMESDEEDSEDHGPIRVVTRFTRKASQTKIITDIYDNFFTDRDLGQNLFWKNTFSLRNVRFTGSASQRQRSCSLSLVPVKQSSMSLQTTTQPINVLGNQDMPFPDPLLYHLEDRISRELAELPLRFEDLQTVVANPSKEMVTLSMKPMIVMYFDHTYNTL